MKRRVRGSSGPPLPRFERIEYCADRDGFRIDVVRGTQTIAREQQSITGLLLRGRFFGSERKYDVTAANAVSVHVPAVDLQDFAEDVIDVYVTIRSGDGEQVEDLAHPATVSVVGESDGADDDDQDPTTPLRSDVEPVTDRELRLGRAAVTVRGSEDTAATAHFEARIGRTIRNNISIRTEGAFDATVRSRLVERRLTDDGEHLEYEITSSNDRIVDHAMLVTGRNTQTIWPVPTTFVLDESSTARTGLYVYRMNCEIDFDRVCREVQDAEEILDINYTLTLPDGRVLSKGVYPSAASYGRTRSFVRDRESGTLSLTPYETFRSRRVAYRVERFEPGAYQLLRRLSKVGWLLTPVRLARQVWLVGEVPYKAQDNGLAFFRYASARRPGKVFYVIRDDVADAAKIPADARVAVGSRRHVWYSVLASRLVGSHHSEYLLASRDTAFVRACRGVRIFLQHGVTAMKNVTPNYGRLKSVERPTEKFLVVSEEERRIVMEDFGYRSPQVPVVGFARYDTLFEPAEVVPRILVMPTWRDSLKSDDSFLQSAYYQHWNAMLTHADGIAGAVGNGYQVTLLLHPNMRPFAAHFQDAGVEVLDLGSTDVQEMLKTSAILVTDFSSVAWDFAFLDKPVIYFQFDIADLVGRRTPHIDFSRDLPGPQCFSADQVWEQVLAAVDGGGRMGAKYRARASRFIEHRDQHNCARIFDLVRSPGTASVIWERARTSRFGQRMWLRYRQSGETYFRTQLMLMRLLKRMPAKEAVVFEVDRGGHSSDSPRAIYEQLVRRDYPGDIIWVDNSLRRYASPRTSKIRRNTPAYFRALARSRYWVTNQNLRTGIEPGRDQFYLQTWHGTPLKRMQFDVADMKGRDDDYRLTASRQTQAWSALLSPSPYATRCFRSAFGYDGPVIEEGYPRNDVLVDASDADVPAIRRSLGIDEEDHRPIVLYAPTFRDDMRRGRKWRHSLALDLDAWAERFGDSAILVLRLHPLVKVRKVPESLDGVVIDATAHADVQSLLLASDVLVTDYSSIFFDYALLRRPIVFYAYDLEHYENELRGFYLPYRDSVPGPVVQSEEALIATVERALAGDSLFEHWDDFLATYAPMDDGSAAARVVEQVFRSTTLTSLPQL